MKNIESKPTEKKRNPLVFSSKVIIPLIIPQQFVDKVKYLCQQIPRDEWSGILIYKIHGSINQLDKLKIELDDILLMDIGTASYTEYKFDSSLVKYLSKNPTKMKNPYKIGHIHSHNTMGVFFSGTDNEELQDNAPNHNFYLSVIVNNYMEVKAALAINSTVEETVESSFTYMNENGQKVTIKGAPEVIQKEKIVVYDCEPEIPVTSIKVPVSFQDRLGEVRRVQKEKREADKKQKLLTERTNRPYQRSKSFGSQQPTLFFDPIPNKQPYTWIDPDLTEDVEDIDNEGYEETEIRKFAACYLMNDMKFSGNTANALAILQDEFIQAKSFATKEDNIVGVFETKLFNNFYTMYANFFGDIDEDHIVLDVLEKMYNEMQRFDRKYPAIVKLVQEAIGEITSTYDDK